MSKNDTVILDSVSLMVFVAQFLAFYFSDQNFESEKNRNQNMLKQIDIFGGLSIQWEYLQIHFHNLNTLI